MMGLPVAMSDEFIQLATKEIHEEILGIKNILNSCLDDAGIFQNSGKLQKHTHKIKGLAPMMGKNTLGNMAAVLDDVLKQIMEGKKPHGIFDVMNNSAESLSQNMNNNTDLDPVIEKTKNLLSDLQS